jgi:dolichol kinase
VLEPPSIEEVLYTSALMAWVLFVTLVLTRFVYRAMLGRGLREHVAVYFNRKIIHILAGGLPAVLVPILFRSYLPIAIMVTVLAVGNYYSHMTGKLLHWYQVRENMYEVHFIVMWGLMMAVGFLLGDKWVGVVPIMFMSVGDGVTGIVRNLIYKKRTKALAGNLAMMAFCVPFGYLIFGLVGALSGLLASLVEKLEFRWVDDNITVPLVSLSTILAFTWLPL